MHYSLYTNPPFIARVVKDHEPMRIQTFASELAIEVIDVAIIRRLARS